MKLETYFLAHVQVHNNLSKWKISRPLYPAVGCKKKATHGCVNLENVDPYSQHFSLNAQGTPVNYFRFM